MRLGIIISRPRCYLLSSSRWHRWIIRILESFVFSKFPILVFPHISVAKPIKEFSFLFTAQARSRIFLISVIRWLFSTSFQLTFHLFNSSFVHLDIDCWYTSSAKRLIFIIIFRLIVDTVWRVLSLWSYFSIGELLKADFKI